MHWTLLSLWTCCCLTASISTPPTKDLPPDWPPLPDFKQHVDYVKWLQERLSVPPEDDARPLWNEIVKQESDSEQVKQAKNRMWADDEKHGIPGLFTGDEPTPDQYAWDPDKHPQWETAYQAHLTAGLPAKLAAIAQRKGVSQTLSWYDPREHRISQPSRSRKATAAIMDPGLRKDDHLLINVLSQSHAMPRQAVKTLLQDAWRAPQGAVSADTIQEAIRRSLGIANQLESVTLINYLVNVAIRSLIYDSALEAIGENVFNPPQLTQTRRILTEQDHVDLITRIPDAAELADVLDVLQFIYRPQPDGNPNADMDRLQRLVRFYMAQHEWTPELYQEPLDLAGLVDGVGPHTALQQVLDLHLQMRRIRETLLPQVAVVRLEMVINEFKTNLHKHVLARQQLYPSLSRCIVLAAEPEAQRRATHLLYALHIQHNRTGEWPATIGGIVGVSRAIRTDPFSGKDFCYRIQDGRPLLYSVGFNGKDDGGKHDRYWGERCNTNGTEYTATDYVFWPIRPRRR